MFSMKAKRYSPLKNGRDKVKWLKYLFNMNPSKNTGCLKPAFLHTSNRLG